MVDADVDLMNSIAIS